MGSTVKKVVGEVVDVTKGIVTGEFALKVADKALSVIGEDLLDDVLGLDKLGREVSRVGNQLGQVGKVLGGEYHDDMKAIQRQQERIQSQINAYNNNVNILSEKIDSLIAFHEIFQMAASNRLDEYTSTYGPQLDAAVAALNRAAARLRSEYDFVIGLTEGSFIQKLAGSIIMIIGGLMSDLEDIAKGKANSETWKRAITVIILIVIIIFMWWNPVGWMAITAAILTTIVTFMTLDGMYANGAATGAIMSALDFVFNDLLNLDDIIGSDFEKFDKDHKDYQEMVTYTKLAMSLGAAGISFANGLTASSSTTAGAKTVSDALTAAQSEMTQTTAAGSGASSGAGNAFSNTNMSIGSAASNSANSASTFFGIDTSTYSSIYKAFSAANDVKDIFNAKKSYDALLDKFREDALKLETAIGNKYSKNFMKHYKDTAYFLQDQQEYIDRYIWGMTSENMYVDPYGTTPVANIRFTPDKDTRVMSFGFEDMFDENSAAGSKGYFNSILYGS